MCQFTKLTSLLAKIKNTNKFSHMSYSGTIFLFFYMDSARANMMSLKKERQMFQNFGKTKIIISHLGVFGKYCNKSFKFFTVLYDMKGKCYTLRLTNKLKI